MKRIFLWLLTICMLFSVFSARTDNAEAASYPNINASKTVQFIANRNVNVYTDANLRTRGTSSPYRKYNAYAATNDLCYILGVTSPDSLRISYPTGSGYKQGYVRRSDVLYAGSPSQFYTSKAKVTTYRRPGGSSYGYVAVGDSVYVFGNTSGYRGIIYNISGGKYKFGWIRENELSAIVGRTNSAQSSNNSVKVNSYGYAQPISVSGAKWSASTSGNNGCKHDVQSSNINGKPVYAIQDGKITCSQKVGTSGKFTNKLVSYGNIIEFTSSDGKTRAKYAHLSRFAKCNAQITASAGYNSSASVVKNIKTINLGTYSVKRGDVIGYVGTTGNSTGPHLHFELYRSGTRVSPDAFVGIN